MKSDITTENLRIGGMTCVNCQIRIEKRLRNTVGIKNIEVKYSTGTAVVTYDVIFLKTEYI